MGALPKVHQDEANHGMQRWLLDNWRCLKSIDLSTTNTQTFWS